ncbi:hypothetical protein TNCV_1309041 [Trichonephila clavipes]|nr:hypothetical protein TNCV_1309041 [Trichonephila clavipes]
MHGADVSVKYNQSNAKPLVFSSQAILALIYRPTEGMKGSVDLAETGIGTPDLWRGSEIHYHSATGLPDI